MRWILSLKKPMKYREFATILTIGLHVQVLDQKMVKKGPKLTRKQRIPRITTGILIICLHVSPKKKKHSTPEIPAWSPTAVLIGPNGA